MVIVGHRGARNEAPENTVAGFVHAQRHGCKHFELDIQLSSDHELVVFHDSSLMRTTGERGKLNQVPFSRLRALDARLSGPYWPTPCPIPSLQEVVDAAPYSKHWQFEVKTDSRHLLTILTRRLSQFIASNGLTERVTVTSGDRWFLSHLQAQYPHLERGYVAEYPLPHPVDTARKLACRYLVLNHRLATPKRVKDALDKGMIVSCWTVNDIDRMIDLQKMGVQSLITDIPSIALKHRLFS